METNTMFHLIILCCHLLILSIHSQGLLAVPLVGLYMGGAAAVRAIEQSRIKEGLTL